MVWFEIAAMLAAFLAATLFLLLYSKISIKIEYRNEKLKVVFKTLLFRYTLDDEKLKKFSEKRINKDESEPKAKTEKSVESFFRKAEKLYEQYKEIKELAETALEFAGPRIEFSDIFIRMNFGTGDAAKTGMAYGAVWVLVGNVYAFLCRYTNISFPDVELNPDFNNALLEIEAGGIIKIRLAHIIMCGIKIINKKIEVSHRELKGAKA